MKILYMNWNSYGNLDMQAALKKMDYELLLYDFATKTERNDVAFEKNLGECIMHFTPDFVFSFDYFPVISKVCNQCDVTYVSWVYDNPQISLYSYTAANPCNRIFVFDKQEYLFFHNNGIHTVHYLPLATNPDRLYSQESASTGRSGAEISFVGSLYTEPKHQLYEKLKNIPPYTRGYLDAVLQAQKRIYGYNFVEELLNGRILEDLKKACPCPPNADGVESEEYIYSNYFLLRKVTAMERDELIRLLSQNYQLHLYTNDINYTCANCINHGPAEYYTEAPLVFFNSKINLNITLRSIKSGIPLRAFDIMGCGGFLLTNYQEDFLDCFVPDEDFVYYSDPENLLDKVGYYLSHEKERREIAQNGYEKVRREHTFEKRIPILFNSEE
ncbi:MAG: DUF3880 domain-containing protein [Lachnospiraceae bacterium]|nr:DUF3880 domain-containing protein [Lachnospiraceae bacterium]MDD7628354.1 DUF3880 domain-containing protein [Lachnospiraceae bacterium]MDY4119404.1 DUF3880 domain-containing protein [Lachnospiraceae bacterium]